MNKIILLISVPGSIIGGAQKRYLSLFNYISSKRNDYYLVINKKLYITLYNNNLLKNYENVRVLTLFGENKLNTGENLPDINKGNQRTKNNTKKSNNKKQSKIRFYIGSRKFFLKTIVIWITFIFEFRKVLKELNSNIVYAIYTGGMFAWPLKKIFKFKLMYSYNDASAGKIDTKLLEIFNQSEYWILKNADKIDFLSLQVVDELKKSKIGVIEKDRILITPNSFIDYENFYSDTTKENHVTFLARLWPKKNPMLYLESIKVFNEKYPDMTDIKFFIIGEGGLVDEIKQYIISNKLHNTCFAGNTHEPWLFLRKSKVFVSIMQYNNYPSQALIEAMACENAIIASDVGETRLIVTENEGILVDYNPETIADAIYKLFSTQGLIEKLGSNARKKVIENHTVEKFADYFYSITNIQHK